MSPSGSCSAMGVFFFLVLSVNRSKLHAANTRRASEHATFDVYPQNAIKLSTCRKFYGYSSLYLV